MVTVQLTLRMGGSRSRSRPVTATDVLLQGHPLLTLEVLGTTGTVRSVSVQSEAFTTFARRMLVAWVVWRLFRLTGRRRPGV